MLLTITLLSLNHHFNGILTNKPSFLTLKTTHPYCIQHFIMHLSSTFLYQNHDLNSLEY